MHTPLGVTGSNFEMKPERRRMPGFGLHFKARAGHAEWSVREGQNLEIKKSLKTALGAAEWRIRAGGFADE